MFQITEFDPESGCVIVEDEHFGLRYEFHAPNLLEAKIVNDYDLLITTQDGENKILPILSR
jgi:hypothetical protein